MNNCDCKICMEGGDCEGRFSYSASDFGGILGEKISPLDASIIANSILEKYTSFPKIGYANTSEEHKNFNYSVLCNVKELKQGHINVGEQYTIISVNRITGEVIMNAYSHKEWEDRAIWLKSLGEK